MMLWAGGMSLALRVGVAPKNQSVMSPFSVTINREIFVFAKFCIKTFWV